jgi:hypothetical protein
MSAGRPTKPTTSPIIKPVGWSVFEEELREDDAVTFTERLGGKDDDVVGDGDGANDDVLVEVGVNDGLSVIVGEFFELGWGDGAFVCPIVGTAEGSGDGCGDGTSVGAAEWTFCVFWDGWSDGNALFALVEEAEGRCEGWNVLGDGVGVNVGLMVGYSVGFDALFGCSVGILLGSCVPWLVGWLVVLAVGWAEGRCEGWNVGKGVGARVGLMVGASALGWSVVLAVG